MIEIFKTGLIEYPEKRNLTKPVKFEEQHLKEIASLVNKTNITNEHGGEVIGELANFTYKDGVLYADEPDVDYKNKGFSPSFEFGLIDKEDYYIPYGIKLLDVALTNKPKSHIFYNSIKGDVNLDLKEKEELLNRINDSQKRIREQEQEIGILKNKNETLSNELKTKNETIDSLKEKENELVTLQKEHETIKIKAEAYDNLENSEKEELIKELAADNDTIKEKLNKMSLEDIKFFKETKLLNTNPKGVPSKSAPGQKEGDDPTDPDEPKPEDAYAEWDKENDRW